GIGAEGTTGEVGQILTIGRDGIGAARGVPRGAVAGGGLLIALGGDAGEFVGRDLSVDTLRVAAQIGAQTGFVATGAGFLAIGAVEALGLLPLTLRLGRLFGGAARGLTVKPLDLLHRHVPGLGEAVFLLP